MNYLLIPLLMFVVVLGLLMLSLFAKRPWVRLLVTSMLVALTLATVTLGMGGLRGHIEEARSQGKSEDFVAGLAERSRRLLPERITVAICSLGLGVMGLAGSLRHRSRS